MSPEETFLWLRVVSQTSSPEQIQSAIGLQGDRSWVLGGKRPPARTPCKENGWQLDSGAAKSAPLCEHLEKLKILVGEYTNRIHSLPQAMTVHVGCAIYAESAPPRFFERDTIAFLASMGATLDLDLYI